MKLNTAVLGSIAAVAASMVGAPAALAQVPECVGEAMIAEVIIKHRQNSGWPLTEMMERLGSDPRLREVILDAYDQPRLMTEEARQFVIDEFVNDWTLKCFSGEFVMPRIDD